VSYGKIHPHWENSLRTDLPPVGSPERAAMITYGYPQRQKARSILKLIQERTYFPRDASICGSCERALALSPDCPNHPGICCECVEAVDGRLNHKR